MIKAVYFDVDDTLYDQMEPFDKAFREIFTEVKVKNMGSLYKLFRTYADKSFPAYQAKQITIQEMWILRLSQTLNEIGVTSFDDTRILSFQKIYNDNLDHIKPYPQLMDLIKHLKKMNISVGIISNGDYAHQMNKVRQLGLLDEIPESKIFVSGMLKISKPHPEIFNRAVKAEGVAPNDFLYVGDNFENDIYGGTGAGLKTVWFNHRAHKTTRHDVNPDLIVTRPDKVGKIVDLFF